MESTSDTTLRDRVLDWDGSFDELESINWGLSVDFNDMNGEDDESAIHEICELLLARDDVPLAFRAQFLVFLAATEDDDDVAFDQLWEAKSFIEQVQDALMEFTGPHEDVNRLGRGILRMINDLSTTSTDSSEATATPTPQVVVSSPDVAKYKNLASEAKHAHSPKLTGLENEQSNIKDDAAFAPRNGNLQGHLTPEGSVSANDTLDGNVSVMSPSSGDIQDGDAHSSHILNGRSLNDLPLNSRTFQENALDDHTLNGGPLKESTFNGHHFNGGTVKEKVLNGSAEDGDTILSEAQVGEFQHADPVNDNTLNGGEEHRGRENGGTVHGQDQVGGVGHRDGFNGGGVNGSLSLSHGQVDDEHPAEPRDKSADNHAVRPLVKIETDGPLNPVSSAPTAGPANEDASNVETHKVNLRQLAKSHTKAVKPPVNESHDSHSHRGPKVHKSLRMKTSNQNFRLQGHHDSTIHKVKSKNDLRSLLASHAEANKANKANNQHVEGNGAAEKHDHSKHDGDDVDKHGDGASHAAK